MQCLAENSAEKNIIFTEQKITAEPACIHVIKNLSRSCEAMVQSDTLEVQLDYLYTDTLNRLVPKTDTIYLANKLTREQREKLQKKANEVRPSLPLKTVGIISLRSFKLCKKIPRISQYLQRYRLISLMPILPDVVL